ncbi:MAG TPA: glutamine--fructose-6-phosphate transaminase (isomerizing), partial [Gaiellaceae bacterium]
NAHPLTGCDDERLAVVLNGIVENYRELKAELEEAGHRFSSETDAEVVSHLFEDAYEGDLVAAALAVFARLEGHFAFVVIHHDEPHRLVGVRHQCPLVVGLGEGENFVASNLSAFLSETRHVQFPDDGMVVEVTPEGVRIVDAYTGEDVELDVVEVDWDDAAAERSGYETFMLKEIYEQPEGVAETIGDRVRHGHLVLEGLGMSEDELRRLRRIVIVACGTAYHAGVVGRYAIEEWGRVPVEPDVASEWIYRNPVLDPGTLVIGISQSGETRDTIQAMKLAREKGARTVAITNMMGSQITREVDSVLFTRTGLEVGVAASKTFTAQVALLFLIGLKLAQVRATLPPDEVEFILDEVYDLPQKMQRFLDGDHPIEEIAQRLHDRPFFLYLGRHVGLPVALEGALKLKEISYIPTEAYSAGEMKHGPIALLEEGTPVVVVATRIHVYDKIVSNIQETRARGAHVIAIATDGNEDIQHHADDVIYVPTSPAFLQAALAILPLQLLAYRIARLRGLNVDQPRNLAKTVTVE